MLTVNEEAEPLSGNSSKPNSMTTPPGITMLSMPKVESVSTPIKRERPMVQGAPKHKSLGFEARGLSTSICERIKKSRSDVSLRDYLTKLSLDAQSAVADLTHLKPLQGSVSVCFVRSDVIHSGMLINRICRGKHRSDLSFFVGGEWRCK